MPFRFVSDDTIEFEAASVDDILRELPAGCQIDGSYLTHNHPHGRRSFIARIDTGRHREVTYETVYGVGGPIGRTSGRYVPVSLRQLLAEQEELTVGIDPADPDTTIPVGTVMVGRPDGTGRQVWTPATAYGSTQTETDAALRSRIRDYYLGLQPMAAPAEFNELELATDEHLDAIGRQYGIERRQAATPVGTVTAVNSDGSVNVQLTSYLRDFKVEAKFARGEPRPEPTSRYDRLDRFEIDGEAA